MMRCLVALLVLVCFSACAEDKAAASLYERVGRYDGISAIAEEYLKGVRADPAFARFSGRGADSLRRAKQLLKDQLCSLSGGPCTYIGRDMKTAHSGLGITPELWEANMRYMGAALDKAKVVSRDVQIIGGAWRRESSGCLPLSRRLRARAIPALRLGRAGLMG